MALRLKGVTPKPGEPDRRYYMIDVQEGKRRARLSSGTRDRALAERREQAVLDALREDLTIPHEQLQAIVRGAPRASQAALVRTSGAMTLKEACDQALKDRKPWTKSMRRGWADAPSRETYAGRCRMLQKYLGAATPVNRIDQDAVDDLADSILDDGRSQATANRNIFALLAVLRRCKKYGTYTGDIPEFTPFDESDNSRTFVLSQDQEAELFDQVLALDQLPMTQTGGHPRVRNAHDFHDLFVFLADVGCRLTAGLRVRWTDIVEEDGQHYVRFWRKGEQKGGRTRTTPLTSRVTALINARRSRGGYGPFSGLTKRRAAHIWNDAKKRTSLANEKEAVIHCLRHTCATRMLHVSGDIKLVQEWLGHSAIQTTSGIYAKVLTNHKVAALGAFEARWNGPGISEPEPYRDSYLSRDSDKPAVTH